MPAFAQRTRRRRAIRERARWERLGKPTSPPPLVKQAILRDYVDTYELGYMVETGTYLGDTTSALAGDVDHLVSIELSEDLHRRARERLGRLRNVTLLQGDSAQLLRRVAIEAPDRTLFWLDAHYSHGNTARGEDETPILDELKIVLDRRGRGDVVLVDDARVFGQPGWPTIDDVRKLVVACNADLTVEVVDDIIRIHEPRVNRNNPHA